MPIAGSQWQLLQIHLFNIKYKQSALNVALLQLTIISTEIVRTKRQERQYD